MDAPVEELRAINNLTSDDIYVDQELKVPVQNGTPVPNATGLTIGGTAKVIGTGTDGVNMRQDAGLDVPVIETLAEGTVFELIGGPSDADGITWWQVRLDNG